MTPSVSKESIILTLYYTTLQNLQRDYVNVLLPAGTECIYGWFEDTHTGMCYLHSALSTLRSWFQAKAYCLTQDAQLASPDTLGANTFIQCKSCCYYQMYFSNPYRNLKKCPYSPKGHSILNHHTALKGFTRLDT